MNEPMSCGCRITPGGPIGYVTLREHITKHIPEGLFAVSSMVFMLELLRGLNHLGMNEGDQRFYLETYVPFRIRLMELSAEYDEKIKPRLEKIWPVNPIAEALL